MAIFKMPWNLKSTQTIYFQLGGYLLALCNWNNISRCFVDPGLVQQALGASRLSVSTNQRKLWKKFIDETTQQRRNTEAPLSYACPFSINFSFIGQAKNKTKRHWKPQVFHLVSQSCNVCSFFLTYHATTQLCTNTSLYCIFSIAGPYNYNRTFT